MTTTKRLLIGKAPITALLFMLLFVGQSRAQAGGTITGTVTDADTKEALPASTVQIPKIKAGAKSDATGSYKITKLPAGTYTVEAKLIGYLTVSKTVTVPENETVTLNFTLSARPIQQDEIIVTGLSGEVDRKKLGNVIGKVEGADVAKVVSPTAIDAIAGRVTGVNVTRSSGTPGAGTYIQIRGRKSVMGGSEPLYVVDGVVMDNSSLYDPSGTKQLSNRAVDINPQDIESMEILKGASAAALYGALAGNGVVLITTKRGKLSTTDRPAEVIYSSSFQSDTKTGTVPLQTIYGQTTPYKVDSTGIGKPGSNTSWGAKLPAGTTVYDNAEVPFRTASSFENTLSISGGVPDFSYLISGTLSNIEGTVIGSELDRRNIRLNLGANILPKVSIQSNNNFVDVNNDLPQDGSNTSGILLGALRTPPEFNNQNYLEPNKAQRRFGTYDNPLWTQHFNTYNSGIQRFIHSTDAKWNPIEELTIDGRVGYDRYEYDNTERLAVGSATSDARLGEITHNNFTNQSINLDLSGTLTEEFSEDVSAAFVAGIQRVYSKNIQTAALSSTTLPFFDEIPAGASKDATSKKVEVERVGYFGQGTFTFLDRISLTLGARYDGSSTFGVSKKFHLYPKASLAYTLSDESFMQDLKGTIDLVKLRAAYGHAGSPDLPGAYATNFLYGTAGFFDPWDRSTSSSRAGFNGIRTGGGASNEFIIAGNSDIRPELAIEREIGLDLGLWDNRISLEATFYHTNKYDLILNVPVASSTGYDQVLKNAGSMWNEGFEVGLSATPVRTEDFSWSTTFNYSRNYNLVTSLNIKPEGFPVTGDEYIEITGGFQGIVNVAQVGRPLGVFRGVGWLRDENGRFVYSTDALNNDFQLGALVNAPQIDQNLIIIGDPNPSFSMSWRNDLTVLRNFTFSFLFDAVFGNDVWNGTEGALYNFGTHGDTKDREEPWFNFDGQPVMDYSDTADGKAPVQATKELYYRYYANGFLNNEAHIEDGSFIKLREVILEYRWDGLKDIGISQVKFVVSARNLLTITDYQGYDPEVNTFGQAEGRGYDYFTLPQSRSYRFGISLTY